MTLAPAAPLDKRGQFIPIRRSDLLAALLTECFPDGAGDEAARLAHHVTSVLHFEYMDELESLHAAYHYLDPTLYGAALTRAEMEAAHAELAQTLEAVLKSANFVECSPEEIALAGQETGKVKFYVRSGIADFRSIRLFRRGSHTQDYVRKSLFGLRKKTVTLDIYDEVLLFAAVKPVEEDKRLKRRRPPLARPGSVVIKLFHDIARADLDALLPEVRVVMSLFDKLMLGVPAVLAGVPLLIKLAPAVLVLYGLLRYYFGDVSPGEIGTGEALVVASGLVALGGFMMAQWTKIDRRALRYQKEVSDLLYFHNVTNNVGIFDHLIGVAEEQEAKEVLLAYFTLLCAPAPLAERELDREIEAFLRQRLAIDVDFDVGDALAKLDRYHLLKQNGDRLSVLPMPLAFAALERHWQGFLRTEAEESEPGDRQTSPEMDETEYLLSSPANAERLRASIREADAGRLVRVNWPR